MIELNDEQVAAVKGGTKIPYIVQSGDTLSKLSKKFNVSIEQICKWNNIKDPNKIDKGQLLTFFY